MKNQVQTKASKLKDHAISGVTWSGLGQISKQIISFIFSVILIRLLSPKDFGQLGMVIVFTGFAQLLVDFGFGASIIQKKRITKQNLSSIFWFNCLIGIFITCIVLCSSNAIAQFYNNKSLKGIVIGLSFSYFFNAVAVVPRALLQKYFKFKILAIIDVLAILFSGIVAIAVILSGGGIWGLVFQHLALSFFSLIFCWIGCNWRPKLYFEWSIIQSTLKFTSSLFLNSSLSYIVNNIDNLLIGRLFGERQLGLYNRSFAIISLPVTNISSIITRVMFPLYSSIQLDYLNISKLYLKVKKLVAFVAFPLMTLILVSTDQFVLLLFGENWIGTIPLIKIFSVSAIIFSINSLLGSVIMSQGRSDLLLREAYLKRSVLLIAILGGLKWGIIGIAYGRVIADFINLWITFYHVKLSIKISIKTQVTSILGILLACVISGITMIFLDIYLFNYSSLIISLICNFLMLYLLFILTLSILDRKIILDLYALAIKITKP